MKITIAIVSFLLLSLVAEGQFRVNKYPVFFSQYMNCHALYNPASISARSPLEVCAGSKRNMGNWSNFATYFAALSMDMPFKSPAYKSTGNTIGVRFTGDKEGVYLQQTKLYVAYAWHSKINENWRFSGGLEVGGFNYSAKGTYTTGDRSISNLDANVGIWIYRDGLHFGISGNQLLNSVIKPYKEAIELTRFYTFSAAKKFIISSSFAIESSLFYRYYYDRVDDIDVNITGFVTDYIIAGGGYRRNYGMVFMFGVNRISINEGNLNFILSYNMPTSNELLNINTYEVTIGFKISDNKNQEEGLLK